MARPNRDVISRQQGYDQHAADHVLNGLKQAKSEWSRFGQYVSDPEERKAFERLEAALEDAYSDFAGSTEHVRTQDPEAA